MAVSGEAVPENLKLSRSLKLNPSAARPPDILLDIHHGRPYERGSPRETLRRRARFRGKTAHNTVQGYRIQVAIWWRSLRHWRVGSCRTPEIICRRTSTPLPSSAISPVPPYAPIAVYRWMR